MTYMKRTNARRIKWTGCKPVPSLFLMRLKLSGHYQALQGASFETTRDRPDASAVTSAAKNMAHEAGIKPNFSGLNYQCIKHTIA